MTEPKNNYKIKPYRSEEENENRNLYRSKDNIRRKWFSICSNVNEHDNKGIYEKCLVQAFNLTEFVMDNFIEQLFDTAKNQNNIKKIENTNPDKKEDKWKKGKKEESGTYFFIKENVTIDFDTQFKNGYFGKTQILEKLGYKLPQHIHEVRKNRNKYAHGTDTYKNSIRDEVNNFETIVRYINTMGELLVMMKKLAPNQVNPSYEELKLQVGKAVGHEDKYVALTLVREDEKERVFYGKDSSNQREVCIYELIPPKNILDVYHQSKKELVKVAGSGIVRTEEVLLKNKTCYIIKEKIQGDTLPQYLRKQNKDIDVRKDMLYQVEKIIRNIYKYPNISTSLRETDLIVDGQGDLWLTQYELGKKQISQQEFVRRYRLILDIQEEITEMPQVSLASPESDDKAQKESVIPPKAEEKRIPVSEKNTGFYKEVKEEKMVELKQKTEVKAPEVFGEPTVHEVKKETVRQSQDKVQKEKCAEIEKVTDATVQIEIGSNPNNWAKLWGTLGVCSGILLILWAVSGLLT